MAITRRNLLQALGVAGATAALPRRLRGDAGPEDAGDRVAILYDPTHCIGCKECIKGCVEANGTDPYGSIQDDAELAPDTLTVLHRFEEAPRESFVKHQCMHCLDPACVSACMLGAMRVDADGAVVWNADLCVGCRYCQIGCPFNRPRFEWDTPLPELRKCELCPERRARGLEPACIERCARGALVYGTRDEMLAEARARMEAHPDRYEERIYGEKEAGGTAWLYMAPRGVSFAEMGLPELREESVPSLPETLQHTLYKGFIAPMALLGLAGAAVHRNSRTLHEEEARSHAHERSEPVGGRILTWPFAILATFALIGAVLVGWRFLVGLGPTTNLSDGYPMGLWIAFDVVTGTALACGGYAVALLVYVANRGRYHPLVRAAVLTSALGYTLGGLSVLIDIGRAWNFYKIPLWFWEWNFNSILLEVALCIMLYTTVLWIEVAPAILEGWRESRVRGLRRIALMAHPWIERALPAFIALGLVLPTMHQSSLGSLMLLAGEKLHALWYTPWLPALFLVSCVAMGYAVVTLESLISSRVFDRPRETPMLRALALPAGVVLLAWAALRAGEVWSAGEWALVTRMDAESLLFLAELALLAVPGILLLAWRTRAGPGFLSAMAVAVILGGALHRFSTYLFAFDPGPEWSYVPSLAELGVTVGLISFEILAYSVLVKRFPILRGAVDPGAGHRLPAGGDRTGAGVPAAEEAGTVAVARSGESSGNGAAPPSADAREEEAAAAARPEDGPSPGPSPVPAGVTGAVLLLALAAGSLEAQDRSREDLRCLTSTDQYCLDEPVPVDEPHEARCATCHNLWEHESPDEAVVSCTEADCHDEPLAELGDFHQGMEPEVLDNCLVCHPAHDVRIEGGYENCAFCHTGGGDRVPVAATAPRPGPELAVARAERFDHDTHREVDCLECHTAELEHGELTVTGLQDCRSCHHTEPQRAECATCHVEEEVRAEVRWVERRFDIHLGNLNEPVREVPFEHTRHEDVECTTCHTEGLGLTASTGNCESCHEEHHRPTASCASCHLEPDSTAHDLDSHLGCTGAGCHTEHVPGILRPFGQTRSECLACHQDQAHHEPQEECVYCHFLPAPSF
jgi:Ni/Fe-hydrogenase subunit HybB-like protein/Fe-S-cluster-containing dehydrogenase component